MCTEKHLCMHSQCTVIGQNNTGRCVRSRCSISQLSTQMEGHVSAGEACSESNTPSAPSSLAAWRPSMSNTTTCPLHLKLRLRWPQMEEIHYHQSFSTQMWLFYCSHDTVPVGGCFWDVIEPLPLVFFFSNQDFLLRTLYIYKPFSTVHCDTHHLLFMCRAKVHSNIKTFLNVTRNIMGTKRHMMMGMPIVSKYTFYCACWLQ